MYIRITSVSENCELLHYVPNIIFAKVDLIFAVSLVLRLTNFFRKVSDKSRNKSEVDFKVAEHSSSSNSKFGCRSSFCIFVFWSILAYSQKLTLMRLFSKNYCPGNSILGGFSWSKPFQDSYFTEYLGTASSKHIKWQIRTIKWRCPNLPKSCF